MEAIECTSSLSMLKTKEIVITESSHAWEVKPS